MKTIFTLFAIILLLFACQQTPQLVISAGPKTISSTVNWRIIHHADTVEALLKDGSNIVVPERLSDGMFSLSLRDGTVNWRIKDTLLIRTSAVKISDMYYTFYQIQNDSDSVKVYMIDAQGKLKGTIDLSPSKAGPVDFKMFSSGSYIYWITTDSPFDVVQTNKDLRFVARLDTSTLTQDAQNPEVWHGTVEHFWDVPDYDGRSRDVTDLNFGPGYVDIPYSLKVDPNTTDYTMTLYRIDTTTKSGLKTITPSPRAHGQGKNLFFENAGEYFLMDGLGLRKFDPASLDQLWVNQKALPVGGHWAYDTNTIYYTGYAFLQDSHGVVGAVDRKTGKLLWRTDQLPYSMTSAPVLHNGLLWIAGPAELLIYDAATGTLVGHDPSIKGDIDGIAENFAYGDNLIIRTGQEILSVKMNWVLENGMLVEK